MKHPMTSPRMLLLLGLFALQCAVPLMQVYREEMIRREGAVFRLALRPVDPYDMIRGRYLTLMFEEPKAPLPLPDSSKEGDIVYAVLQKGDNGMAHVVRLSATPEADAFATPLKLDHFTTPNDTAMPRTLRVNIPLTRFYLPEEDAITIDRILMRTGGNNENRTVHAALDVRVKDGRIVAESLWLDGRPYREWLQEYAAAQNHES